MNKILSILCIGVFTLIASSSHAYDKSCMVTNTVSLRNDITGEIPAINFCRSGGFQEFPDTAQYKNGDWSHVVGMAYDVNLTTAIEIANSDQDIDFFFYTKGVQMTLETDNGDYRVFHRGDAVFFSGTPSLGTAPGLADSYMKTYEE